MSKLAAGTGTNRARQIGSVEAEMWTIGKMGILVLGELVRNISQEALPHEHMKHLHLVLVGQILQTTITVKLARRGIVVQPMQMLQAHTCRPLLVGSHQ